MRWHRLGLLALIGCGSGAGDGAADAGSDAAGLIHLDAEPGNPAPTATTLTPASALIGSPAFTLHVAGDDFVSSSVVLWQGTARPTTFVSATALDAEIAADDVAAEGIRLVEVATPEPGGGTSVALLFTVTTANVIPELVSLDPPSATAQDPGLALHAHGSSFVAGTVVSWDGAPLVTTFVSSAEVVADIPAADLAAAGTATVTVTNPAPGGGTSDPLTFTIAPPGTPPSVLERVSVASDGTEATNASYDVVLGVDGRYVAFTSNAANLFAGDNAGSNDVFVRDTCRDVTSGCTPSTTLVSEASVAGTRNSSARPGMTPDGRFVAFQSRSTNLVAGDTNNAPDVFVRNLCTGAPVGCVPSTERVSLDDAGGEVAQAANGSDSPTAISADGRYVAFDSYATALVAGDANGMMDVFVRDTCRGVASGCTPSTTLVSVASDGTQGNQDSRTPSMSADGRYIAFYSDATTLIPSDTNFQPDIFLRDTCAGATSCTPSTIRVTVSTLGVAENGGALFRSVISATGRFVAFATQATNLTADPLGGSGYNHVFLRDTCLGASGCTPSTILVSAGQSPSSPPSSASFRPGGVTADGRYVVFESSAMNLVPGDTLLFVDVFLRDTCFGAGGSCTPQTTRLSVLPDGTQPDGDCTTQSSGPALSGDGRFAAFASTATNLVAGDGNGWDDDFLAATGR